MRGVDLNHRPLGYEPNELPDCSTPRIDDNNRLTVRQTADAIHLGSFANAANARFVRQLLPNTNHSLFLELADMVSSHATRSATSA